MHDMNPHILNAMKLIAGAHRDLHFQISTREQRERVKAKLVCALGDLGDLAWYEREKTGEMFVIRHPGYESYDEMYEEKGESDA